MKVFRFLPLMLLLLVMSISFSCTKEQDMTATEIGTDEAIDFRGGRGEPDASDPQGPTIVDIAVSLPDFSTLVEAVVKAGLVDALSAAGPYTVFAPTNDAFEAFLSANGFSDIDDVPVDLLTTVLTTHVLAGEFFAADISTGYFNTLAAGPGATQTDIFVQKTSGVSINGSINVIAADVDASNGVIHVIDAVIAPSDIVTLAASNPNFSILVEALTRPDLSIDFIGALSGAGPLTVVAPTNDAFINLLNSNPAWNSLDDIPAEVLESVLLYHVAGGNLTSSFLLRSPQVNTLLSGSNWTTSILGGLRIVAASNTAGVVAADVQAQNGVIHAIDTVILP